MKLTTSLDQNINWRRMLFSQKSTIHVTHRSQTHLKYIGVYSFVAWSSYDTHINSIDLEMILAIEQALVEYKHVVKLCVNFEILFIWSWPWSNDIATITWSIFVKMYRYTENEVPGFSSSKVIARIDTERDRHRDLTEIST